MTQHDDTAGRDYQTALQNLIGWGNNADHALDRRIPEILGIAHRYFGMRFGVLNRISGTRVIVEHIADSTGELFAGQQFDLDETYCGQVASKTDIVMISDIATTDLVKHVCYKRIPLGSLLTAPVFVGNRLYGILLFGDIAVRHTPFTPEQINLLQLAAQWLGHELAARERHHQLEAREKRYRNLYRRTPVMMHSVDWSGRLVEVSNAWLENMGYRREEVIGHQAVEFMTEDSALKAITDALPGDSRPRSNNHREPYVLRRRDGSKIEVELSAIGDWSGLSFADGAAAEFMGNPIASLDDNATGNGSEVSLCVFVDVTERNRAQRSNAHANASLLRANEGLKRFNLIASHDLQEPLRKIRAFGSMLESELGSSLNGDAQFALRAIVGSSQRLSTLVEDLLSYTRQSNEGYDIEHVDLNRLLEGSVRVAANDASMSADVFTIDPLPVVLGGRIPLERLFSNLLANAIKYRHPDRPLRARILVNCSTTMRDVEIVVRDNGVGIPQTQLERVFEPFRRLCTRQEIDGTGIGLAICRMIAIRHGWKLSARAAPEHGTDFCLELPVSDLVRKPDQSGHRDPQTKDSIQVA